MRSHKKKRGRFSKAFHKLLSGQKSKQTYDEKEKQENIVGGVHAPANGYVTGHTGKRRGFTTSRPVIDIIRYILTSICISLKWKIAKAFWPLTFLSQCTAANSQSLSDGVTDSATHELRTLQGYNSGGNQERMMYMEKHSPLTSKGLAVSAEQVSIFLTSGKIVVLM